MRRCAVGRRFSPFVFLALAFCAGGPSIADEESETPLDRALAGAWDSDEHRVRFYDLFLKTELFVPLAPDTELPPKGEERPVDQGETIRLLVREVGGVPTVYAFDTPVRLGALRVPEVTSYVRSPGRDLLSMLPPNVQVLLNQRAVRSKILSHEELEWLRKRAEPRQARPEEVDAAAAAALELLVPEDPPPDVVAVLRELFRERSGVKAAWLAHGRPKLSRKAPHLVIGIEANADVRPIIDDASAAVARVLPEGEFADFFEMGRDRLSKSMRKRGDRFYTRGAAD